MVFMSSIPWPNQIKSSILRLFGAKIGRGCNLRPRLYIHFPWKLVIGDFVWIGDDTGILNLEPVTLESHVALGHRVYLATGNHDYKDSKMAFRNAPISIGRGAWVASCSFVGPGVTIGEHCIVQAGSVVTKNAEAWTILKGNPAVSVGRRVLEK
jgi:putative colanic acid biosynthesis acetyltransferase WcaF